ncbi:MAG: DUF4838 domain-containing protein [Ruminococcaceae bacterium]|nr:DUF4838 domain-containing protein [Oscillospiraceae bacterium]
MKHNAWTRLLTLILIALMLLPFAACGEQGGDGDQSTQAGSEQESADTTTAETQTDPESETGAPTESETEPDDGIPLDALHIGGVDITSYTLVVQEGGAACVRNSANELVEYLEKATGFHMEEKASDHEIVIGVTDRDTDAVRAARDAVELDGYTMLMDGGRLYITGSCDRGTMYGVYDFLEEFVGVRFFAADTTVIIEQESAQIPADYHKLHNPAFDLRDTYWYDMRYKQDFANHSKDNSFYDSSTPVPDIGGGVGYAGRFVHTFSLLTGGTSHTGNVQPCLTDEEVYQTVLSNVRAWLDENPEATIISVSQNDSDAGVGGCQCENCKAINDAEGSEMGSLLTFVNRIANDIKDDYPGVYVDTLAYRYTRKPPKNIRPAENVIIRLCSIECCFTHALSEACIYNTSFRKDIEAWSAICDNLYIWDYTYNAETYFTFFPNFDVLCDNVKFYKEHNVKGVFLEGQQVSVSGEFAELRSYLLAKLLWDPDMTEDEYYAHMDEFLQYYYGPGWVKIKEYMQAMTAHAIARNTHVGIFDKGLKMYPFTKENGKRDLNFGNNMKAYWDEALEMAQTEEQRAHVEKSSIQAYYLCSLDGKSSERKANLKKVYELCEKYGIEYYKYVIPMPDASHSDDLNSLL